MNVLKILLPVLTMIALGVFCRRMKLMERTGVDNVKTVMVKIMLPVTIFHALGTAQYSMDTLRLIIVMFLSIAAVFVIGHLARPAIEKEFRRIVPYMVGVYEGGMIAYPLFASLCGSENLSVIATVDIAGCLFGFSVYLGMLRSVLDGEESGETGVMVIVKNALRTPTFIATVLGLIFGLSGLMDLLLACPFGPVYLDCQQMVTAPMTAMILLAVGYDLSFEFALLKECLKTVALRFGIQGALFLVTAYALKHVVAADRMIFFAVALCMFSCPPFSAQSMIRKERQAAYAGTTISLCLILTIAVFAICAAIY